MNVQKYLDVLFLCSNPSAILFFCFSFNTEWQENAYILYNFLKPCLNLKDILVLKYNWKALFTISQLLIYYTLYQNKIKYTIIFFRRLKVNVNAMDIFIQTSWHLIVCNTFVLFQIYTHDKPNYLQSYLRKKSKKSNVLKVVYMSFDS